MRGKGIRKIHFQYAINRSRICSLVTTFHTYILYVHMYMCRYIVYVCTYMLVRKPFPGNPGHGPSSHKLQLTLHNPLQANVQYIHQIAEACTCNRPYCRKSKGLHLFHVVLQAICMHILTRTVYHDLHMNSQLRNICTYVHINVCEYI